MTAHEPVRATIVRQGRCAEDGWSEPYAELADGRTMPMGWNRSGPILPVGTTGTAVYVRASYASLWKFTPDEEPARARSLGRYVTIGVWADGVPVEIDEPTDDLAEATRNFETAWSRFHRDRQPPFIGIADREDPERGFGPWDEE